MNVLKSILWRTYASILPSLFHRRAEATLLALNPRLPAAIKAIWDQSGGRKPSQMPYQALDMVRVLRERRPNHIVELGSGQSTPVFAAYAAAANVRFTSYEQDVTWAELSNMGAEMVSGSRPVVQSPLRNNDSGGRYELDIPADADLVYVDGPFIKLDGASRFGKSIYMDVPDLIDRGHLPKTIMCEGRLDTVEILKNHPIVRKRYSFEPGFLYCFHTNDFTGMLSFNRHSLFFRND